MADPVADTAPRLIFPGPGEALDTEMHTLRASHQTLTERVTALEQAVAALSGS